MEFTQKLKLSNSIKNLQDTIGICEKFFQTKEPRVFISMLTSTSYRNTQILTAIDTIRKTVKASQFNSWYSIGLENVLDHIYELLKEYLGKCAKMEHFERSIISSIEAITNELNITIQYSFVESVSSSNKYCFYLCLERRV
jgi:hypothetical protein